MQKTKKLDPENVKKELINLYSKYLSNPNSKGLKEKASQLHWDYCVGAQHFLDEPSCRAVWKAIDIELGKMTSEKAKEILNDLTLECRK